MFSSALKELAQSPGMVTKDYFLFIFQRAWRAGLPHGGAAIRVREELDKSGEE
jgi:hypothetical protein